MRNLKKLPLHIALLLGWTFSLAMVAEAAVFQVNSSGDAFPDGCGTTINTCTLREAVIAANNAAGLDTITFSANVTSITLANGEIVISDDLTFTPINQISVFGDPNGGRIFNIAAGADTIIDRFVLANAVATSGNGGAVLNNGAVLTINNSIVRNNEAANGNGGGISTLGGTLNIYGSTIGSTTPLGSNRAGSGGGIYNENGAVNLVNSTISGNFAANFGGGYYGFVSLGTASLTARKATVARNAAPNGGGIAVSSAVGLSSANLENTIVGDNTSGTPETSPELFSQGIALGIGGTITSSGYNLIESTVGSTIILAATDQTGDAALLPLAANGGLTPTHALRNSGGIRSNAIDKGSQSLNPINTPPTVINTDQRGETRPFDFQNIANVVGGDGSDIGAFELQLIASAAEVTISGRVTLPSGRGIFPALVTITDLNGGTRSSSTNFLGYYRIKNVPAGETYVLSASSKRRSYSSQVVAVTDDISNLNFVAQP